MRLGTKQLQLLAQLASPTVFLVTPDRRSASLVRRGLLREVVSGACCITPAGLRRLADAIEAGQLVDSLAIAEARRVSSRQGQSVRE